MPPPYTTEPPTIEAHPLSINEASPSMLVLHNISLICVILCTHTGIHTLLLHMACIP
jgi:hypothetical protein